MHETITLFGEICNNEFFAKTSIILFLNKRDLFAQKIQKVDLTCAYPDYTGGMSYDNAASYIENKFREKVMTPPEENGGEKVLLMNRGCVMLFERVWHNNDHAITFTIVLA